MAASNIDKVGFFDSKMVFPNIKVTPKRKVKLYEIELFTETAGTTVIDGREHQIRKGRCWLQSRDKSATASCISRLIMCTWINQTLC